MTLKRPFFLKKLKLESNIVYAPLAGCSDMPFRKMCAEYKPGLMFCEMVKMESLIRSTKSHPFLDYTEEMHPIGAQICGSNPKLSAQCGRILEDLGFDVIDLNCGCPVDKVVKDGSGSGLLKTPQKLFDILANLVATVKIPVTLKIRTGWDDKNINCEEITQIAENVGCAAIFIHGRTRKQGYKGLANRDHIRQAKQAAKHIKVFGNGDVFDGPSAKHMFEHTGCDGLLIARGTLGNPWICEDLYRYFENNTLPNHPFEKSLEAFEKHFGYIRQFCNEKKAVLDARRTGCWYFKNRPNIASFRKKIVAVKSIEDVLGVIEELKSVVQGV